jgi:putative salt-induced outer membrane protein YdiY
MRRLTLRLLCLLTALTSLLLAGPAAAQAPAPPPPPPGWTGSFGAGLALTGGNTETFTTNFGYDVLRDYGTDVVFRSDGVYLRGSNGGVSIVDRSGANARVEYKVSPRLAAFGMTTYARDRFKDIDYLLAPTAGLSYQVVATERTKWTTDGSAGVVFEKNTGFDLATAGALIAGEGFSHKFSETTRFVHAASGLWKMNDFDDAFYTLSAGVITAVAGHFDLKAEFLNTYKARPTDPTLKKSDRSVVLSVVYRY